MQKKVAILNDGRKVESPKEGYKLEKIPNTVPYTTTTYSVVSIEEEDEE